jgi:hypothetical protein
MRHFNRNDLPLFLIWPATKKYTSAHSAVHIVHSAVHIVHGAVPTVHSAVHTVHSAVHIVHSAVYCVVHLDKLITSKKHHLPTKSLLNSTITMSPITFNKG